MSLDSILEHILKEADNQKEKIIQEAREQASQIIQQAQEEARQLYAENLTKEKMHLEKEKQKLVVQARLESKKNLLKAKQELIDSVFENLKPLLSKGRLKKERVYVDKIEEITQEPDFYLEKIRRDYEIEIARILFV